MQTHLNNLRLVTSQAPHSLPAYPPSRSCRVPTLGVLGLRKKAAREGLVAAASDSRRCGRGFKARNCASISSGGNQVSEWRSDLTIKCSSCKSIFVASKRMILQHVLNSGILILSVSSINRGLNESSRLLEFFGSVSIACLSKQFWVSKVKVFITSLTHSGEVTLSGLTTCG